MPNSDLISRAAAMDAFMSKPPEYYHTSYIVGKINCLPAVNAVPVRHGHIDIKVINPYDGEDCYCSECGHWSLLPDYKWCPYCGAKFDAPTCGPDYCEIGGVDDAR